MTKRLQDFEPLWPAEQRMADWIRAGNMDACRISDSLPAEDAPKEVRLRASFVRYLALGGCDACRVPRKGLLIRGAYIEGDGPTGAETLGFYLKDSNLPNDLALLQCRFPDLLMLRNISLGNLFLTGSCLRAGLLVDGLAAMATWPYAGWWLRARCSCSGCGWAGTSIAQARCWRHVRGATR